MRLLLAGAGSVGAYFCGRAVQGGAALEVIAHSGYDDICRDGFSVKSIVGDFSFRADRVLKKASEASENIDAIILATKVLPEIDQVALIRDAACRSGHPPIVMIQNGIGIEDEVAEAFPNNEIISVIAYIGASRRSVNFIEHRGAGRLIMGRFGGGDPTVAERIAQCFRKGGVPCDIVENIALERWRKLLWNLPFNPVSVLGGGLDSSELCDGGEIEKLCSKLMDEVIAVANACGVPLTRKMADEQFEYTRNFPPYKTSMLQDFLSGRPLEVDAVIGNVLDIAVKHAVDVPCIRCCAALLKAVDKKNRAEK